MSTVTATNLVCSFVFSLTPLWVSQNKTSSSTSQHFLEGLRADPKTVNPSTVRLRTQKYFFFFVSFGGRAPQRRKGRLPHNLLDFVAQPLSLSLSLSLSSCFLLSLQGPLLFFFVVFEYHHHLRGCFSFLFSFFFNILSEENFGFQGWILPFAFFPCSLSISHHLKNEMTANRSHQKKKNHCKE